MSAQNRSMREEYDETSTEHNQSKSTVARYQKELKERARSLPSPGLADVAVPPGHPHAAPPASTPFVRLSRRRLQGRGRPINVNTASPNDWCWCSD